MTTEFSTDSSPGEQAFESTVDDAVAFFEAAFHANEDSSGPRMSGVLRSCIRAALRSDGSVSPKQVARTVRTLSEQNGLASDEIVDSVLRRVEAMVDENSSDTVTNARGI